MKRKRSRQERCEGCAYCVLTPSLEKSAYCELKEYAVEMWWQACKYFITHDQRGELLREWKEGRKERLQERLRIEKEFYEKQEERKGE